MTTTTNQQQYQEPKDTITIECMYFKDSGKYYTHGKEEFDKVIFNACIYPREYGQILKDLKILPGLASGTWDGPFIVTPSPDGEESYTELVMPEKINEVYVLLHHQPDIKTRVINTYTNVEQAKARLKELTRNVEWQLSHEGLYAWYALRDEAYEIATSKLQW